MESIWVNNYSWRVHVYLDLCRSLHSGLSSSMAVCEVCLRIRIIMIFLQSSANVLRLKILYLLGSMMSGRYFRTRFGQNLGLFYLLRTELRSWGVSMEVSSWTSHLKCYVLHWVDSVSIKLLCINYSFIIKLFWVRHTYWCFQNRTL